MRRRWPFPVKYMVASKRRELDAVTLERLPTSQYGGAKWLASRAILTNPIHRWNPSEVMVRAMVPFRSPPLAPLHRFERIRFGTTPISD
ncbi:hypothetical protein RB195_011181 [Necator americanus]|uniref:Uncharacterized protein n=1 Tax=Necator americanus TaxID=51031 RepID=A0ABR1D1C3_NECAM